MSIPILPTLPHNTHLFLKLTHLRGWGGPELVFEMQGLELTQEVLSKASGAETAQGTSKPNPWTVLSIPRLGKPSSFDEPKAYELA